MHSESRTIETSITRSSIVDLVAVYLQAIGLIHDCEEITNIQFGELFGASDTELVPIKIHFNKKEDNKTEQDG